MVCVREANFSIVCHRDEPEAFEVRGNKALVVYITEGNQL